MKNFNTTVTNISFTAKICYNGENFVCEGNTINDALNLKILKPAIIKGFTLSVNKNGLNGKFKAIEKEFGTTSAPLDNVATVLYNIFSDVINKEANNTNDNCTIDGKINNLKYSFIFSPSGLPIELKVKSIDLQIKFNNVTIVN
ncbi:MAG: hypothetical protein Q4B40_06525 [Clostridia bacterium]|nr:hypothetical protein [Clostridia bacterium]